MADVTLPYQFDSLNVQFEDWIYTFSIGSLSYNNTASTDSDITTIINSYDGTTANITVYSVTTITRSGTDPGSFLYTAYPALKITADGVDETFYSTSGSVSVGGNDSQQIIFSSTFDYVLPPSFVNKEWTITHFIQLDENSTSKVDTGTQTSPGFTIPVVLGGAVNSIFFGTNF